MNKKKSIVILCIVSVFIILMAVFAVLPTHQIGNSIYDYTGYARTIKLGLDMSGGVSAVFNVANDEHGDFDTRVSGTISSLQSLLVSKGYTEATVTKGSSGDTTTIRVEIPDVDDPEKVLDLIGRPASLYFTLEDLGNEASNTDLEKKAFLNGREHLENAYVTTSDNGQYAIGLKFNDKGAKKFGEITSANKGKKTYIYVGGQKIMEPTINAAITNGSAIITGNYTYQSAYDYATKLQSGTFGVTLQLAEIRNISATLGENSIRTALIAGAVGVALIFIFMACVYRGLGIAADLSLCVYIVLLIWFCAVLPWVQLTLPGIAGILLSIGMAVDANVIIFERVKDEYKHSSKPISTCIKIGFKRSAGAIVDGQITTLIGAIVLWVLGSASIVGFAVTLFIGILLSLFCSLVVTRLILKAFMPLNSTSEKFYGLKRVNEDEKEEDAKSVSAKLAKEEA